MCWMRARYWPLPWAEAHSCNFTMKTSAPSLPGPRKQNFTAEPDSYWLLTVLRSPTRNAQAEEAAQEAEEQVGKAAAEERAAGPHRMPTKPPLLRPLGRPRPSFPLFRP